MPAVAVVVEPPSEPMPPPPPPPVLVLAPNPVAPLPPPRALRNAVPEELNVETVPVAVPRTPATPQVMVAPLPTAVESNMRLLRDPPPPPPPPDTGAAAPTASPLPPAPPPPIHRTSTRVEGVGLVQLYVPMVATGTEKPLTFPMLALAAEITSPGRYPVAPLDPTVAPPETSVTFVTNPPLTVIFAVAPVPEPPVSATPLYVPLAPPDPPDIVPKVAMGPPLKYCTLGLVPIPVPPPVEPPGDPIPVPMLRSL